MIGVTNSSGHGLHSNPNLLDNWYFKKPVNQRGKTENPQPAGQWAYFLDRWLSGNDESDSSKTSYAGFGDDLYIERNTILRQIVDMDLTNHVVTISALDWSGRIYTCTGHIGANYELNATSGGLKFSLWRWTGKGTCVNFIPLDTDIHLIAVKLELGSTQTLAHQESGVWVLNEIPDYGEQFARCQRYYCVMASPASVFVNLSGVAYSNGTNNATVSCFLPVRMRATPSVEWSVHTASVNGNAINVSGISVSDNHAAPRLRVTFDGSIESRSQISMLMSKLIFNAEM